MSHSADKISSESNPLAEAPKREKSGSDTFRKYNYQYHWAFCRLLDEHSKGNQYAVFVEEHEDVVLADSLKSSEVKFEFSQVKETTKKHTVSSLVKIDKKSKNSLLGKLGKGLQGKSYNSKIKRVCFVSTGGFSFDLHKRGYSYDVIKCEDLSWVELETILKCFKTENGDGEYVDNIINNIEFLIPDLPSRAFDDTVEGRISRLLNKTIPGCTYNSGHIYDCVIRDLHRKGENTFDYTAWEDSLKKKAVTSEQFQNILDQFVHRKPDSYLLDDLKDVLSNEYSMKFLERKMIVNAFERYYTRRLGERDSALLTASLDIQNLIGQFVSKCKDVPALEENVRLNVSKETRDYFGNEEELIGAILYEIISG